MANAICHLGFFMCWMFETMMTNTTLIIVVSLCVASSETTTMNVAFDVMVFFLCVTYKTRTSSSTRRVSFTYVLQALKLRQ
jgi:hypothetical protein